MNYKRVTKSIARRMFNMGHPVKLLPCKVGLESPWVKPSEISLATCSENANKFDRSVNAFEFFNCNAELGYYAHFYVSEEDYNKCYKYQKEEVSC